MRRPFPLTAIAALALVWIVTARPGTRWIRAGTTEIGSRIVPHVVISTLTDVVCTIDGVLAVATLDQWAASRP